jgi:hypothetical protein
VSSFQTYIGSAFASYPVRWIESPDAARSGYASEKAAEKPIEKVDPDFGKPRPASGDVLDLSTEAKKSQESSWTDSRNKLESDKTGTEKAEKPAVKSTETLPSGVELTLEEQQKVSELQALDQEVRIHEMAHVLAGGAFVTGGPSYTYQTGPDGKGYAVGGSVGIDTSPVQGDPEATIQKMQTVAAAALAPAQPSGQDLKVAAAARQAEAKARAELAQTQATQLNEATQSEESESKDVVEFTIVRSADRMMEAPPKSTAEDAVMPSLVAQSSNPEASPSSAYKAQSVMTLASARFSAFA